ncbi:MAG: SRPBCC family protein [Ardenticatenaceae bacterium]|nr:SRPBCC family protein [Ardenticatenaceae bacterium]
MNNPKTLLSGVSLGAGIMYLLDPEKGERRRALLRDKMVGLMHETSDAVAVTARDLDNRRHGLLAEAMDLFESEEVSDEVLQARIRERLGFLVSRPSSIGVTVNQGRVTLSGPILAHEVDRLIATVRKMHGVTGVENQLEVHERPNGVPGLQGQPGPRLGGKPELLQTHWSPTTRLLVGTAGGWLALLAVRRRNLLGALLGTAGLGMLARAMTNLPMQRLIGVGAGRRAIDVQNAINVNAPVETVFDFWSNFENFPRFMSNVRAVRDLGEGRSHWVVDGPAGQPVEWDAVITKWVPNQALAWKTVPGEAVGHAGIVQFRPNPDGGTRVEIRMSYNPPGRAIGHTVATFFGADPKSEMDEDLLRFKSLIAYGKATAHDKTVTREEISRETREHASLPPGSER